MDVAAAPDAGPARRPVRLPRATLLAALAGALLASACTSASQAGPATTLRLGYLPNLTHAVAIAGVERGILADALGTTRLATATFGAGPAVVEALFSGALDAAYLGPGPAVNAFVQSQGRAVRVVAGAASGGAALVVRPGIAAPADLRGRSVASPQLGATQDVALRFWLRRHGLEADPAGGGDVKVLPQDNGQTLEAFRLGEVDAAWVPEPWVTRLVQEGGGRVLVDERDLWPGGRFATTLLVVRTDFLRRDPDVVRRLVEGHVRATRFVTSDAGEAAAVVNEGIGRITGKELPHAVVRAAWENVSFTTDPVAASVATGARHAEAVGLLRRAELDGIFDLRLLRQVQRADDEHEVHA